MRFVDVVNENGILSAEVADQVALGNCARLLRVTVEQLRGALCTQIVPSRSEIVYKTHDSSAASYTRDALAKVILELFD